jgi:hypothetical protein
MPELASWLGGKSRDYKKRFLRAGLSFIIISALVTMGVHWQYEKIEIEHNKFAFYFTPFLFLICGAGLILFYLYALFLGNKNNK